MVNKFPAEKGAKQNKSTIKRTVGLIASKALMKLDHSHVRKLKVNAGSDNMLSVEMNCLTDDNLSVEYSEGDDNVDSIFNQFRDLKRVQEEQGKLLSSQGKLLSSLTHALAPAHILNLSAEILSLFKGKSTRDGSSLLFSNAIPGTDLDKNVRTYLRSSTKTNVSEKSVRVFKELADIIITKRNDMIHSDDLLHQVQHALLIIDQVPQLENDMSLQFGIKLIRGFDTVIAPMFSEVSMEPSNKKRKPNNSIDSI